MCHNSRFKLRQTWKHETKEDFDVISSEQLIVFKLVLEKHI
jgi:hypothetical protein